MIFNKDYYYVNTHVAKVCYSYWNIDTIIQHRFEILFIEDELNWKKNRYKFLLEVIAKQWPPVEESVPVEVAERVQSATVSRYSRNEFTGNALISESVAFGPASI